MVRYAEGGWWCGVGRQGKVVLCVREGAAEASR